MKTRSMYGGAKVALVVAMVVLGVVGAGLLSLYGFVNSTRNEGIGLETQLNAQYLANQNELSTFVSSFYEQVGVANLKSAKMDEIITDAVKGRYEGDAFSADGAFFAAVSEAYPDLGNLNLYDRIVDYIQAQREGYRGIQDKLLDMLQSYDAWRQAGLVQSWIVESLLEIPSERLEARIGDDVVRGRDARERMFRIVLASQARDAYESGTFEPLALPGK